jgi:hypothetical protein
MFKTKLKSLKSEQTCLTTPKNVTLFTQNYGKCTCQAACYWSTNTKEVTMQLGHDKQ